MAEGPGAEAVAEVAIAAEAVPAAEAAIAAEAVPVAEAVPAAEAAIAAEADHIWNGERSPGFIPLIPQKTIVNVLNFFFVNMKKVDQQVISTQIRSHYLYWAEKVHNVIVLCGVQGLMRPAPALF